MTGNSYRDKFIKMKILIKKSLVLVGGFQDRFNLSCLKDVLKNTAVSKILMERHKNKRICNGKWVGEGSFLGRFLF